MAEKTREITSYRFTTIKRAFKEPVIGIQIQWHITGDCEDYDGSGYASIRDYDNYHWYDAKVEDLILLTEFMNRKESIDVK